MKKKADKGVKGNIEHYNSSFQELPKSKIVFNDSFSSFEVEVSGYTTAEALNGSLFILDRRIRSLRKNMPPKNNMFG